MARRQEAYDAIVVGSGITGGWAAKELCEAGLRVLMLEAGREIAAADSGPLDIADRGSAQNQAANTNFSEEEQDQTAKDMLALGDKSGAFRGY